jgi:hypothetical protein
MVRGLPSLPVYHISVQPSGAMWSSIQQSRNAAAPRSADRRSGRREGARGTPGPPEIDAALLHARSGVSGSDGRRSRTAGRSACWAQRCSRRPDRPVGARADLALLEPGPARAEDEVIAAGDQAALEQGRPGVRKQGVLVAEDVDSVARAVAALVQHQGHGLGPAPSCECRPPGFVISARPSKAFWIVRLRARSPARGRTSSASGRCPSACRRARSGPTRQDG